MKYLLAALVYIGLRTIADYDWAGEKRKFLAPDDRFTFDYNTRESEEAQKLASHLYWRKK